MSRTAGAQGPIIINLAPTGMIPTRDMSPHVPMTPAEIASDVEECAALGVSAVHIHARDRHGVPTGDREVYREIIRRIRAVQPDLVVTVSTSGRLSPGLETRAQVLDLDGDDKPDMASLTLSSLNFNHTASINPPDVINTLLKRMNETGIKPELEAFDLGMINVARYLIGKGLLTPPHYFNLIFGNIACAQANLLSVGLMVNELPAGSVWGMGGVGDAQAFVNALAVVSGAHVRVGLEDHLFMDQARTLPATNRMLVARVVSVARAMDIDIATPAQARAILGLAPHAGSGGGT